MEQNQQKLRKAVSDVSKEIDKYYNNLELERQLGAIEEVEQAECQCCGLNEECTAVYITEVRECYCGKWVCGLCSEAVKERVGRGPKVAMQDALNSHRDFCQEYNATTRLNPQLSLTFSMREIAKRSLENRKSKGLSITKLSRTTSYP
ncbi:palmitoyl-acyl carrier protein thioesterase [Spatholobus suberectus]|nr:palmitoyl-acyl carrier protein thioesterase [Spatholobus suberectus]